VSTDRPAFAMVNGRYSASGRTERRRLAGQALLRNLKVDAPRFSRLVNIGFTSPDAEFSALISNAWADTFIRTNLERKVQATSYGRNLLQQQLAQAKEKLDRSQRVLVGYATEQQIINLPSQSSNGTTTSERSLVADNLAALNVALSQATADRIQTEARYQQAGQLGASTEALSNPAINNLRQRRAELAAQYQEMMIQFEPGYPTALAMKVQLSQLDQSIAREEGRVSGSLKANYREAVQRESVLEAKVNSLKASYLDLRRRSIQYNIFQQEADTNRVLYDGLLQRFKEIGVAGGVGVNNISIVDPADVPQKPSSPRLLVNLAIAILFGLVLGAGAALVLEEIDETITDPEELQRVLGLPLLGAVPKIDGGSPLEALKDRKSELVDAYLAVVTNLGFTTERGLPRSFAVTSTRPAEGKSTTAFSIAATLSRSKRRIILIDADMRSPSVHDLGGVANVCGLSNFLAGDDNIEMMTFKVPDFDFFAMPAGPIPPNAAELLSGHRLELLIERLLENYDNVIIDCPPVMGLADAPLVASRVEGVIYTVESHKIRANLVKAGLNRLVSANARVIGAVLTKFEARRASYGYGDGYGYGYGYGYGRDRLTEQQAD